MELRFVDNGVGMGPEQLTKLFEPFFSTKIGGGGTGLGMSIVKNLVVEKLQGRIAVESTLGQGSCFVITLPRVLLGNVG
ncbi:MAG: ATP-binding protein [Burkholderiales bacterium]|nr:ATP-binding protein [Burkholderiales bacterium]